ncbi:MAG: hypothetical protein K2X00_09790 [Nitrospiraceae bacterium]|nr:hypothetical protein [Nitrospiraceae bacterium]
MDLSVMDLTDDDLYQQAAAQSVPMAGYYEMLYDRFVMLLERRHVLVVSSPEERTLFHDEEGRLVEAVMLGALLHEDGGVRLMRAFAYRVAHRLGVETYAALSRCWYGIGDWGQIEDEPAD